MGFLSFCKVITTGRGTFFHSFPEGELATSEKFARESSMKHWPEPEDRERVHKNGYQYVLKVFVEGNCTQSYKEMLQFHAERCVYNTESHRVGK